MSQLNVFLLNVMCNETNCDKLPHLVYNMDRKGQYTISAF